MHLIEMKNIKKEYRLGNTRVPALRGIDLTFQHGEFTAIWGPSGSGKTTLLNLMGTVDEPSSGDLKINGQAVVRLDDNQRSAFRNRHIGFIFQNFNLISVLTAVDNVMLPLQIQGMGMIAARKMARERLQVVGLGDFYDHRPDQLSGGQRQRVAIARALVTEPAMVLADEPTANLDLATARDIIATMQAINSEERTTFIFSTHDQRLLEEMGRLVRLEDGRTVS